MISAIRKKFGSWLLDAFIWMSLIGFVLVYLIPTEKRRSQNSQWAVSVNGDEVDYQQYLQALQSAKRNKYQPEESSEKLEKKILDSLTNQLLMEQVAESLGVVLTQAMLSNRLLQMLPNVGEMGKMDLDNLRKMLGDEQFLSLQDGIAKEASSEVVKNMLNGCLYLPKFVLENNYRIDYAFKKFGIVTVPESKAQAIVAASKSDTAALKAFFASQNQATKRYWNPEVRTGGVWTFTPANFDIKVSDSQIKSYYNRHRKDEFVKQRAQVQVRQILFEKDLSQAKVTQLELVKDPSKFAELAKKYSDDKATADKGGLMDFFVEGAQEKSLSDAAFDLQADGEVSGVIKTGRGNVILQRVGRKPAQYKTLEEVTGVIRAKVTEELFQKLFLMNARQVISKSVSDPDLFKQFVLTKKANKQELKQVELSSKDEVVKLFELKKTGSKVAMINGKDGIIVVLDQIQPAKAKDFEQNRAVIVADYQKHLLEQAYKSLLGQVSSGLLGGQTLEQAAHKLGLEYEETPLLSRDAFSKLDTLRKKGVPVELFWSLKSLGSYKSQGGYLVRLNLLQKAASEDFKSKKGSLMRGVSYQYTSDLYQSFVASLHKNATIKVNTAIINLGA